MQNYLVNVAFLSLLQVLTFLQLGVEAVGGKGEHSLSIWCYGAPYLIGLPQLDELALYRRLGQQRSCTRNSVQIYKMLRKRSTEV